MSGQNALWRLLLLLVVVAAVVILLNPGASNLFGGGASISYTQFMSLVDDGVVEDVTITGNEVSARLAESRPVGPEGEEVDAVTTVVPDVGESRIVERLEAQDVEINAEQPGQGGGYWLLILLPWLIIAAIYFAMWRRSQGGGQGGMPGPLGGLSQTKAKRVTEEMPRTTFDNVAGQESAKQEVSELVEFLRDPERYQKLGAEVPHGILLSGPPGTGKTLMARALAGEAGVPYFHISGSEFIEMVVGVGAARVRQTFEEAKKHQPAILFIDEIDAIGRQRGTGMGGGHDEREQTLNQILDEMDGFEAQESVIVIAATNRPDVLDPALLRPGRFDRHVTLGRPDKTARREILDVHTQDMPLADDVDLDVVAAGTPGFSGADLKNLVNEAAMAAGRDDNSEVAARHFDEARDKLLMGAAQKFQITDKEKYRLAVHESGHTVAAYFLENADPIYKVTIIPRGQALGGTHQLPEEERYTMDEAYLKDRLTVMLAGRVMEREFLGTVSSGADDDIKQATRLARAMVARWGMDTDIGPVDLRQESENPFLGYEMAQHRGFSDQTAHEVDEAVKRLLTQAEDRARAIVRDKRDKVETLVARLTEEETLGHEAIEACLGDAGAPAAEETPAQEAGESPSPAEESARKTGTDESVA